MYKYSFQSDFGIIYLTGEKDYLYTLGFFPLVCFYETKKTPLFKEIEGQIKSYLKGNLKKFDIPYKLNSSPFQKAVLFETMKIEYGKTLTYIEIARKIGNKNASRAVGGALNKNPIPIIIPCHRVISKNGELRGYKEGVELKQKLLNLENINKG